MYECVGFVLRPLSVFVATGKSNSARPGPVTGLVSMSGEVKDSTQDSLTLQKKLNVISKQEKILIGTLYIVTTFTMYIAIKLTLYIVTTVLQCQCSI